MMGWQPLKDAVTSIEDQDQWRTFLKGRRLLSGDENYW